MLCPHHKLTSVFIWFHSFLLWRSCVPLKICWNRKLQGISIRRQSLWEVIRPKGPERRLGANAMWGSGWGINLSPNTTSAGALILDRPVYAVVRCTWWLTAETLNFRRGEEILPSSKDSCGKCMADTGFEHRVLLLERGEFICQND